MRTNPCKVSDDDVTHHPHLQATRSMAGVYADLISCPTANARLLEEGVDDAEDLIFVSTDELQAILHACYGTTKVAKRNKFMAAVDHIRQNELLPLEPASTQACSDPPDASAFCSDPPDASSFCPITYEIMVDPVMLCDGYSYERAAIEKWLEEHDTSPMTNQKLPSLWMVPNVALRNMIQAPSSIGSAWLSTSPPPSPVSVLSTTSHGASHGASLVDPAEIEQRRREQGAAAQRVCSEMAGCTEAQMVAALAEILCVHEDSALGVLRQLRINREATVQVRPCHVCGG